MSYKIGYAILLLTIVSTGFASASTHTENVCTNTDYPSYWQLAATRCADEPGVFLMKVPMNESLTPAGAVLVQARHIFKSAERESAEVSDRSKPLDVISAILVTLVFGAAVFCGKDKFKRWACMWSKKR